MKHRIANAACLFVLAVIIGAVIAMSCTGCTTYKTSGNAYFTTVNKSTVTADRTSSALGSEQLADRTSAEQGADVQPATTATIPLTP